mmetsp:Transcript_18606/g.23447  ORF Transcript_18606/g.23447 Transcript_18606/m.23447 type:complete len:569 (+) Transcript_18606:3-1709(+)
MVLRPFMLRRIKSAVMDQLPDKVERVVRCELSGWQRKMYKDIQSQGAAMLMNAQGQSVRGLNNVIMQLRKVCNHPYLFVADTWALDEDLWRAAGKFELLDRLLPKLKAAGHRVLMFSQMTQVMALLQDYFQMRGFKHLRLDGSTGAEDREQRMYQFNAPDSPYFIFLLSTRAGGLGLNLATADTVILFDSDWNPMMDAQAQDRAHRIGQKNEVRVLRLITNSPVEEKILSRATEKLNMNGLVVEAGKFNKDSKEHERKAMVQSLLREWDDNDSEDDEESMVPDDEQINDLLAITPSEFELYQRMDRERSAREEKIAKRRGIDKYHRLMEVGEVPAWMNNSYNGSHVDDDDTSVSSMAVDTPVKCRKRKKDNITYSDNMTEQQFMKMVEKQAEVQQKEKIKQKRQKRMGAKKKLPPAVYKKFMETYKTVRELKAPDGRSICELFVTKPSKSLYPDYYMIIKNPIDLRTIHQRIKKNDYKSIDNFEEDFKLLFDNARTYNVEGSIVFEDANTMDRLVQSDLVHLRRWFQQTGGMEDGANAASTRMPKKPGRKPSRRQTYVEDGEIDEDYD